MALQQEMWLLLTPIMLDVSRILILRLILQRFQFLANSAHIVLMEFPVPFR